jgi:hypothetical protein
VLGKCGLDIRSFLRGRREKLVGYQRDHEKKAYLFLAIHSSDYAGLLFVLAPNASKGIMSALVL